MHRQSLFETGSKPVAMCRTLSTDTGGGKATAALDDDDEEEATGALSENDAMVGMLDLWREGRGGGMTQKKEGTPVRYSGPTLRVVCHEVNDALTSTSSLLHHGDEAQVCLIGVGHAAHFKCQCWCRAVVVHEGKKTARL